MRDALVKLLEVLYYTISKALGGLEYFISLPGSKSFHNMQIQIFVQFLRITEKNKLKAGRQEGHPPYPSFSINSCLIQRIITMTSNYFVTFLRKL